MRDEGVEGLSSEGETTERGRWGDVVDCVGYTAGDAQRRWKKRMNTCIYSTYCVFKWVLMYGVNAW